MPWWAWVLIGVAVLVLLGAVLWSVSRRRRTGRLREAFGPEYERTVQVAGDRREAESELQARQERRARLDIRPLDPAARQRYAEQWRLVQERFVDSPSDAVGDADELVSAVMRDRGYPMDDFETRVGDISVDHPRVVENYRAAHRISEANEQGEASTEDLRQAMVHCRTLFQELLEIEPDMTDRRPEQRYEETG
jgi:hypothetical protein